MSGSALYIYYRVAMAELPAVQAAARAMQATLAAAEPGLVCALLRRPDVHEGQVTLMETYAAAQGIDAACEQRIEAAAAVLARWIPDGRHIERFEPAG